MACAWEKVKWIQAAAEPRAWDRVQGREVQSAQDDVWLPQEEEAAMMEQAPMGGWQSPCCITWSQECGSTIPRESDSVPERSARTCKSYRQYASDFNCKFRLRVSDDPYDAAKVSLERVNFVLIANKASEFQMYADPKDLYHHYCDELCTDHPSQLRDWLTQASDQEWALYQPVFEQAQDTSTRIQSSDGKTGGGFF